MDASYLSRLILAKLFVTGIADFACLQKGSLQLRGVARVRGSRELRSFLLKFVLQRKKFLFIKPDVLFCMCVSNFGSRHEAFPRKATECLDELRVTLHQLRVKRTITFNRLQQAAEISAHYRERGAAMLDRLLAFSVLRERR